MKKLKKIAIIPAAGKGERMQSKIKKQYILLKGIPVLSHTIKAFNDCELIDEIFLVIPKNDHEYCKKKIIAPFNFKKIHLICGGRQRQFSVFNGLKHIKEKKNYNKNSIVLIHDGVRPFIEKSIIKKAIKKALKYSACIPAIKITDTIKKVSSDLRIKQTIKDTDLYLAQTPQAFKFELILDAFNYAFKTSFCGRDEASIVEHFGHKVYIIDGSSKNIKITTPDDIKNLKTYFV